MYYKCLGCERTTSLLAYLSTLQQKIQPVCRECLPGETAILPFSNCKVTRLPDHIPWIRRLLCLVEDYHGI